MATPETVRRLALAMPETHERPCYGTPGFYVKRKIFARLLDEDSVVIKIDPQQREVLMKADPQAYYITDHYRNYPMVIVRLSAVDAADLKELLEDAWRHAGGKATKEP